MINCEKKVEEEDPWGETFKQKYRYTPFTMRVSAFVHMHACCVCGNIRFSMGVCNVHDCVHACMRELRSIHVFVHMHMHKSMS